MKKTIIISASVIVIALIAGGVILYSRTNTDSIPTMSDSMDVVQNDVAEEPEQETEEAPPVTEEEPEQTEETAPVEAGQETIEPEGTDVAQEETDTETIDKALTDVTALDKTMYATSAVNTRSGPSTEYERVGGLATNEEVHVIGQSNLTAWYQIDVDGVAQFVSNNYLADAKVEVQQPTQSTTQSSSNITDDSTPPPLTPEQIAILEQYGGVHYIDEIPLGPNNGRGFGSTGYTTGLTAE